MFELWFAIVAVMFTAYVVLDGYDLGAGALHLFVARTGEERRQVLAAVGPFWDANEVWLLAGGGAMFAAFPPVYATVFSGVYLAFILLLVALHVEADPLGWHVFRQAELRRPRRGMPACQQIVFAL